MSTYNALDPLLAQKWRVPEARALLSGGLIWFCTIICFFFFNVCTSRRQQNLCWRLDRSCALVSCTGRASARGPGRPAAHGPGRAWIIFCGPGRVRAWNLKARAGPGPVNINFAGRGPGLGLTFPGLGRARAYSESHYYFNIMVKDYLHLSIAKDHCFLCCKCNCTMQCISMASRQACQPIYYPFNTQQWSSTAELQEST